MWWPKRVCPYCNVGALLDDVESEHSDAQCTMTPAERVQGKMLPDSWNKVHKFRTSWSPTAIHTISWLTSLMLSQVQLESSTSAWLLKRSGLDKHIAAMTHSISARALLLVSASQEVTNLLQRRHFRPSPDGGTYWKPRATIRTVLWAINWTNNTSYFKSVWHSLCFRDINWKHVSSWCPLT